MSATEAGDFRRLVKNRLLVCQKQAAAGFAVSFAVYEIAVNSVAG